MIMRAGRYSRRSPRYTLRANDIRHLRMARKISRQNIVYETEILDVSETGLAFSLPINEAPQIGELLALEFTVPGGRQMAWRGRVTRIEMPTDRATWKTFSTRITVAVEFYELPATFRSILSRGLELKFQKIEEEGRDRTWSERWQWIKDNGKWILIYGLLTLATASILWLLSRPTFTYDPDRPTVWGERAW